MYRLNVNLIKFCLKPPKCKLNQHKINLNLIFINSYLLLILLDLPKLNPNRSKPIINMPKIQLFMSDFNLPWSKSCFNLPKFNQNLPKYNLNFLE